MATPGYEGRIRGKFRRLPLRRAATATPYDRPPAAYLGHRVPLPEPGGNRWLAKLLDPPSRFIASSATRLLSSVFRKRLAAPAVAEEAPGENFQSRQEVTIAASIELSAELQENKADSANNATNNSDSNIILEFEQLLEQKTFTRAQFDHLTEILHSRTIDSDTSKPAANNENLGDINVSPRSKEIESSRSHEDLTTPPDIVAMPDDQGVSPVELAKTYMGSRILKVSPTAPSWQSHLFHKHKKVQSNSTCATKPFDLKVPRPFVRFNGSAEIPESGYLTPGSYGGLETYRMSDFPYFKCEGSSQDGYAGSLSFLKPESTRQSGGRQVLKQSSVLDNDFGSFGPARRIHQKFTVMSPSKDMRTVVTGNLNPSLSTPFKKDVQDDSSLIQKPLCLDEQEENGDNRICNHAVAVVLPQSIEMEKKILQQLDKLVPSPKEKSSMIKANLLDESPAIVMHAFSGGQALRKMDIYSTKYKIVQSCVLDSVRDSPMSAVRNSLSHKQEVIKVLEENGPSTSISGVKSISEASNMHDGVIPVTAAMLGKVAADVMISESITVSPHQSQLFR